jgi:ribonuclease HI
MTDKIYLYCDGGCRGNSEKVNIGGWGVLLEYRDYKKELCGGDKNTTNNKMELTSAIEGLKAIKNRKLPVEVIMDSQYVVKGITEWIYNWIKNNWKSSQKKPVENKELWIELFNLKKQFANIKFLYVRGHSGHYGNERADQLANIAMDKIKKNN